MTDDTKPQDALPTIEERKAFIEKMVGILGEGIHAGLRKHCDSPESGVAWSAINKLPDNEWASVIRHPLECAFYPKGHRPWGWGLLDEIISLACPQLSLIRDRAAEITRLQAFKDYVHKRLDEAHIPTYPNGEHSQHGCRIGDRLDIALATPSTTISGDLKVSPEPAA